MTVIISILLFTNPLGNFPLNDDWQYAYPVKTLLEKGQLEFQGVFAPNVLLQIIWGFLFCKIAGSFDFTWLRFSTLVLAGIAVWTFYQLVYKASTRKDNAYFAAAMLVFNPLFYVLAFSFMSDVPFLALVLLSLFTFYKYLENPHIIQLIQAVLWAIASFYIRQPGILLLPAFAIFLLLQQRFTKKAWTVTISLIALAVVIFLSLEWWIKPAFSIDDNYVPVTALYTKAFTEQPMLTIGEWLKKVIKTFVYLGIFALPLLPFLWKNFKNARLFTPKVGILILLSNIALLLLLVKTGKVFPFGGNVWYNFGLGPELLADVYTLGLPNTPRLPDGIMIGLNLIGQLSATLLFLLIFKKNNNLNKINRQFTYFLLLLNAIYLPLLSITSFFDRYLLLPIASFFFVLMLLIEPIRFRFSILKLSPFLLMSLFSIFATKDYLAWNRARYQAFEYLQSQNVSIQEMDAGYELNGFCNYHTNRTLEEGRSFWWVQDDRWMITFGSVSGYEQVKAFPYYRLLYLKKDTILILKQKQN